MISEELSRRAALGAGFGLAALLAAPPLAAAPLGDASRLRGRHLDLTTPEGNIMAMAKMSSNLAGDGVKYGYYSGVLCGVTPGEAVRELVGIIGMSSSRLKKLDDEPGYIILQKELGFFTDLESGKVLERWRNPYTNEAVEPFPIANPAVNRFLRPTVRDDRFYDRVEGTTPKERPFILPWKVAGDRLFLETRTHFWAKNPLDPKVWARESSGANIQVSDMLSYSTSLKSMMDPRVKSLDMWGHWVHVRPWQSWMLMGAHAGHCLYSAATGSAKTLDEVPAPIRALAQERFPEFLIPPTERRQSEPSMVRYMRERKPAPPRETKP